jgi:acetyltransferase-like isoleucine patch superfamily enzyme
VISGALTAASTLMCNVVLRLLGVRFTSCVTCEGPPPLIRRGGSITLGRVAFRCSPTRVELGTSNGGRLEIGDRVFINQGTTIFASQEISIGDDCRIGDHVAIYDTGFHRIAPDEAIPSGPVRIGKNVWLARGVVVMPGVTIGDHTVVAANSVITRDLPARALVAGSPGETKRRFEASKGWRRT